MSSAIIKETYQGVDTGFDASYDWVTPAPSKPVSRPDRSTSGEEALWLSVLNEAWVDALRVPRELVCGPEAKAKVKQIERYLIAAEETRFINWLHYGRPEADTDPDCQLYLRANGMPTDRDVQKTRKRKSMLRPPYTLEEIECLRAWLWITEQHPSFKSACHLSGCDSEWVSDGIYRAVTGRKRGRPRLVHVGPVG